MKIRSDFVSNSSSSSFMLVGNTFDREELIDIVKNKYPNYPEEHGFDPKLESIDDRDYYILDYLDDFLGNSGLEYHQGISDYNEDTYCIGMSFNSMKNDETKQQFIDRIFNKLMEVFGKAETPEVMLDGGFEG